MSEKLGPVDIEFVLKNVNFKTESGKLKAEISGIRQTAQKEVEDTNRIFRTLGAGMAAYFSFNALKGFGRELITVRGEFEQLGIAFETMLGSKATADRVMAEIVDLAASTPFSLTELGQGAKMLLAFKEPADQVADTLSRMGDLAAGASVPVGDLIRAYGKVSAKGKMQAEELNKFAERGIPIISELAKVVGRTDAEIYKMAEQGQIGFAELQQAVMNMTNEGGMFYNLMEKQSKSLTGKISNLGDAWDRMLNDIGEGNDNLLKSGVASLTSMVENYQTILDILKVIIATYGTYRAAIIAVSVTEKLRYQIKLAQMASTKQLTVLEALHAIVLGKVRTAQAMLNKTMLANPYVAVAALIAGVASALVIYNKRISEADEAQQRLAQASIKAGDETAKEQAKVQTLLLTLESENASRAEKERAIKELNSLAPEYLGHLDAESASTREGKAAIDAYIESLKSKLEIQELERELSESINRQAAAKRGDVDLAVGTKFWNALLLEMGFYTKVAMNSIDYVNQIVDKESELQNKITKRIQELITGRATAPSASESIRTIKDLEAELSQLERKRKEATDINDSIELERLKKLIIAKRQEIDKFKIESEKSSAKTELELFSDDLKRKAELYKQYEAYKKAVSEEEANAMYSDLLRQGDSYLTYLTNLLNTLPGGDKKAIVATEWVSNERKGQGDDAIRLEELLRSTATHNQKLLALDKQYQRDRSLLVAAGAEENLTILSETYTRERQALEEANALKADSYKWVYAELDRMGSRALREYIERLQKEVSAKEWSDDAKLMLSQKLAEAEQKLNDKLPNTLREISGVLGEAARLAGQFDSELAKAIDTASNIAGSLGDVAAGLTRASTGDLMGALQAASGILSITTELISYYDPAEMARQATQDLTDELNRMNDALRRQAELINLAPEGLEKVAAYARVMTSINDQLTEVDRSMAELMNVSSEWDAVAGPNWSTNDLDSWYGRASLWMSGELEVAKQRQEIADIMSGLNLDPGNTSSWTAEDWLNVISQATGENKKQLEALYDEWIRLQQEAEEYKRQVQEIATGISFDGFVDEFLESLKAGERSVADFSDNIEEMLRNAIINGFKTRYLMDALEPWYDQFADFSADGLSAEEIELLRIGLGNIFEEAGNAFDELGNLIDLSSLGESAKALSGAIKGVSEETASVIAGQMNAMRINQAEHLTIARSALVHQANTAANTSRMVALLEGAERDLSSIDQRLAVSAKPQIDSLRSKGL